LKSAADLGSFRDPASREYAKHDPVLTILVDRDQFRKLVDPDVAKP
jgi:hypothetical protein